MKLTELLKQDTVTVEPGAYLVARTRAEGYVPTIHDTQAIHSGRYIYRIVGVGEEVEGVFPGLHIVPVVAKEDLSGWEEQLTHPIVIQEGDTVFYNSGRNNPVSRDPYHGRQYWIDENIPEGEEHRHLLASFIKFVETEFSLGVNDFRLEHPGYFEGEVPDTDLRDVKDGTGEGAHTIGQ